jgi:hypothetical protein
MNGLDERGVARERLQRGGLIPLEERREIVLWHLQSGKLEPGQRVFDVAPDALNRVQLWAIRRQEYQAYVLRQREPLGRMGPTVVQEQEIEAVGKGLCEGVNEELTQLRIQIRQFQEAPVAGHGRHGAVDVEPLEHVWHWAQGLDAPRGEAPSPDGQEAEPAFVLAEHPDGTKIVSWNSLLEVGLTGGLESRNGLRLFWCDWGAAL